MKPIARYPAGLVSILEITEGQAVSGIDSNIRATIDVSQLYRLNILERLTALVAVSSGGNVWTVPAGQLWYVEQYAIFQTLGAGQALRAAPAFAQITGTTLVPCEPYQSFVANELAQFGTTRGFWVKPGGTIGWVAPSFTGAFNLNHTLTLARFRI